MTSSQVNFTATSVSDWENVSSVTKLQSPVAPSHILPPLPHTPHLLSKNKTSTSYSNKKHKIQKQITPSLYMIYTIKQTCQNTHFVRLGKPELVKETWMEKVQSVKIFCERACIHSFLVIQSITSSSKLMDILYRYE